MATYHVNMTSTEDLIDELQKRGIDVVPGGNERARGEPVVVRTDEEAAPPSDRTIRWWQEKVGGWARDKGWSDPVPPVAEQIALMHSELSEALEDYRNGLPPDRISFEGDNQKPCGLPTELADTVIRILHFCDLHKIDLETAMAIKHAFNLTRPHRHGGKLC